jgi:hypothetical protein
MNSTKKCEFCDKRGLPLLLVRDAIAPAGAGAPLAEQLPIALDPRAAHYTKRILRSGYVNVYDEARKRWETYFVTPDGYFGRTLQTPGVPTVGPAKPFNCPDEGHRAVASCITVQDPKNATKVWIGFSNVEWTPATRKENESVSVRKRHMVEIDVQAALKGTQCGGAYPIKKVSEVVCEYALDKRTAERALRWSAFQVNSRYRQSDKLVEECESLRQGKGLIVTVPDPAGISEEIALLMTANFTSFTNHREYRQKAAASDAIEHIRSLVRTQTEAAETAAAENIAAEMEAADPFGQWLSESARERTERMRTIAPADLERAVNKAWARYEEKFDDKAHRAWRKEFEKNLEQYDREKIAPLALAHVAWMKSEEMSNYFVCNHDPKNQESGLVYVETLRRCTLGTQDKRACADLYNKWLLGDPTDTRNLLLRAMMLNQDHIAELLKKDLAVAIDLRQIPWDNAMVVYNQLIEHGRNAIAVLLGPLIGVFVRVLNFIVDLPPRAWSAAVLLGLISGHPLVKIKMKGTRKDFRAYLAREMLRASGQSIPEKTLKRAIERELSRERVQGVRLERTHQMEWIVVVDRRTFTQIPPNLTDVEAAQWLASGVRNVTSLEQANLGRWRAFINSDLRGGIVAACIQIWCLTKLTEDQEKSLANDRTDASARRYSAMVAIAGTSTEAIGNALKGVATIRLRYGQGLALSGARYLSLLGRTVGMVAGLVVAYLDVKKFREARAEQQPGLAWLYGASAVAGGSLTIAITAASLLGSLALPVTFVLLLVVIVVGVVIEYVKDNPLQDWLERCPWGIFESKRYPDYETQQDQFNLAIK